MERMYLLLADALMTLHFAFVLFVIVGLLLTLLGGALRWRWVRGRWFRGAHVAAICFVVVQAWMGRICPLTIWESQLRAAGGQSGYPDGFIAYWIHRALYYQAEPWVFTTAYTAFGVLVLLSFVLVPVSWRGRDKARRKSENGKGS